MTDSIKINEIFYSLQGEGRFVGAPSVFIRLSGCPLRCSWCDTKYALDDQSGLDYTTAQIKKIIEPYPCSHIVITGGEPMVSPSLVMLCEHIKNSGYHITIETSGISFVGELKCDLMSISPKLSNSIPCKSPLTEEHKKGMLDKECLSRLMRAYNYQLKFVVDKPQDLDEIAQLLEEIKPNPDNIFLMPQATEPVEYQTKLKWISEVCKSSGFNLGLRLQVVLWANQRGK